MAKSLIDLSKLSYDDLQTLAADVEKAKKRLEARQKREVLKQVKALVAANGFTIAEIIKSASEPARAKVQPKYRNPNNPEETWAGRGLKPKWLLAAIEAGADQEDFAI